MFWLANVKPCSDPCACPYENTYDTQPKPVQQENDIILVPLSVGIPQDRGPELRGALFFRLRAQKPGRHAEKAVQVIHRLHCADTEILKAQALLIETKGWYCRKGNIAK